jgi:ketosteroid isomerase-like protein
MSQENVEIVRAIFRGWSDAGVEGMLPFCHEEFEYLPNEEGGSVHGHNALRRYFERWSEAWDNFDFGPTEFLDAGDYVFVGIVLNGRGRGSGVEVRMEGWHVWLIRGDRAARCEEYSDRAEALEAAGLSEQDAHDESP